jgi:uncharacterized membrane protein
MFDLADLQSSHGWIEHAGTAIELFGVAVIVAGMVWPAIVFVKELLKRRRRTDGRGERPAEEMKRHIGRSLLLGLEILVAADIIETVALNATLERIATLGLLVLVRTFLGWSILLEIEGRWPWQKEPPKEPMASTKIDHE